MCVAAIGAVERVPDVTARYLAIALKGGVTPDGARGAAINVLISRGIPAHRVFMESLAEVVAVPVTPGPDLAKDVSVDAILDYCRGLFGDVPGHVLLAVAHLPAALEAST